MNSLSADVFICNVKDEHIMCLINEFWTEEECNKHHTSGPHCGRCYKDLHGWQNTERLQKIILEDEDHFQGTEEEMQ